MLLPLNELFAKLKYYNCVTGIHYMNKVFAALLALTIGSISTALYAQSPAAKDGMGIVTGGPTGTYIKFGQDMATMAEREGLNLIVKESQGSLANIERMDSRENAGVGIVQSDVLGFLSRSTDKQMKKTASRLRLIFPFYNEEVHLYANKDIKSIKDLQGRRVIVGSSGSGNWLTATNLLNMTGVNPSERIQLSPVEGAKEILLGNADAMFYVAGKPVKLFKNLEKVFENEEFKDLANNVHMVPLTDDIMLEEYVSAELTPEDYSWLGDTVPTIAVKAMLIGFDFSSNRNSYYKKRCEEFQRLGKAIRDNIEELRTDGHPKWNQVNLDEEVGLWERDTCSIQPEPKPAPTVKTEGSRLNQLLEQCILTGEC